MGGRRDVPWWLGVGAVLLAVAMALTLWAMGSGKIRSRHGVGVRAPAESYGMRTSV